jgi:hypothetical protein
MSERIHETLLVSRNSHSSPHPAPMGLRRRGELRLLAPFRPPRPLDNLLRERRASINTTDDVRVHAGCLSGHYDWPMRPCEKLDTDRLDNALRHREIELERVEDDAQRPHACSAAKYTGSTTSPSSATTAPRPRSWNWPSRSAGCTCCRRRRSRPRSKYLQIAIDKTAGAEELEAWGWLMQRIDSHRTQTLLKATCP